MGYERALADLKYQALDLELQLGFPALLRNTWVIRHIFFNQLAILAAQWLQNSEGSYS